MKRRSADRKKPASAGKPVAELAPLPDRPAEHYSHKFFLNIAGKRFELTSRVELREVRKGPAEVIQMPRRPPNEP